MFVFEVLGFYSVYINFVIGFINLLNQPKYLSSYLVFTIINVIINKILKNEIREPRPINGKNITDDENYEGIEKYGMPSGHAQLTFFLTTYLYLVKNSIYILLFELFITILGLYQRWKYNRHTINQLFIGSILGIIIAYLSVDITNRFLYKN